MNPAYGSPKDLGVYNFFSNIQKAVSSKIVLYNFSKLAAGYAFSPEIVKKLVNEFSTDAFVGMKCSTGNCWDNGASWIWPRESHSVLRARSRAVPFHWATRARGPAMQLGTPPASVES